MDRQPVTQGAGWRGRAAVITGASSGIGAAVARRLAAGGLRVLLCARRKGRLEQLAGEICAGGGQAEICAADLSQEGECERLFARIGQMGGVDVLVNNAGLGWYGYYSEMPWEIAAQVMQVNIGAAAHLTRLVLPGMRANHFGRVINIGSISGSLPSQGISLYGASKAFLDHFTTALHRELRGSGVYASVVRAGAVSTEFYPAAAARENGRPVPAARFAIPAQRVAEVTWRLLEHPRRVVYVPRYLAAVPWLELSFGWLIDALGPLLLKRGRPAR